MGQVDASYNGPQVTFSVLNSTAAGNGNIGEPGTLLLVGTAPQGTNQPLLCTSLAQVQSEYGSFLQSQANASQQGFTLEPAAELCYSQQGRFTNLNMICVRAGATQAVININDTGAPVGTAFTLTAKAHYAGSNAITAVLSASLYSLSQGANVQTLSLYDQPTPNQTVTETYSGTPTSIAAQINQISNLVTCQLGTALPGVNGTYTLTGAQNGLNATPTQLIAALNLPACSALNPDFISVLSGDSGVWNAVLGFCNSQNAINQPCQGFLGVSYQQLSYGTVINNALSAVQNLVSSQFICFLANQGGTRRNPVTNLNQVYDGFYLAAVLAALKAMDNPAVPLTHKQINGFISLTEVFAQSDSVNLGKYGAQSLVNNGGVILFDDVTTANPGTFRRENIVAQQDRLIKILNSYAQTLLGLAFTQSNSIVIMARVKDALNFATGNAIILGYNPQTLSVIPSTSQPGRYSVSFAYNPRVEITEIDFSLSIEFVL